MHDAVEDLSAALVLVEAEITEIVQQPAGLRRDLGVDPRDVVGERIRLPRSSGAPYFIQESSRERPRSRARPLPGPWPCTKTRRCRSQRIRRVRVSAVPAAL